MKKRFLKIFPALLVILLVVYGSCRKQYKCGCGKDVVKSFDSVAVTVSYNDAGSYIIFYPVGGSSSTFYFCNPGEWIDKIKSYSGQSYLLLSGKAYYDCTYMMQAANYSYLPPVYQVEVTMVAKNDYGK
ncbi:MAG TPA: hypothetical protein VMT63_04125 [Bacteroidales bacterium]|nr:hypothetical protein [Bacteroidales bacterium]